MEENVNVNVDIRSEPAAAVLNTLSSSDKASISRKHIFEPNMKGLNKQLFPALTAHRELCEPHATSEP